MAGVRRSTDKSDTIAEIIGLKGGGEPNVFKTYQLSKKTFLLF